MTRHLARLNTYLFLRITLLQLKARFVSHFQCQTQLINLNLFTSLPGVVLDEKSTGVICLAEHLCFITLESSTS